MGATSGATFDFDDEISGGYKGLQSVLEGGDFEPAYTQGRERYRNAKERIRGESPALSMGGEVLSGIATPGMGVAKGGSNLLRAAATGAAIGGLSGAGNARETSDIPLDVLKAALMGGVMGAGGSAMNGPKRSQVFESGVARAERAINPPMKQPDLERKIKLGNEDLIHRVFQLGRQVDHYLFNKEGEPVAEIRGYLQNTRNGPGVQIKWSQANGGKGYGKQLYDLVLDTHQNVNSDLQLSKQGSHKVYTDHFTKKPGVEADLASWGSADPHRISVKDPVAFHGESKFPPFDPKYSGSRKAIEEAALGKEAEGYGKHAIVPSPPQNIRAYMPEIAPQVNYSDAFQNYRRNIEGEINRYRSVGYNDSEIVMILENSYEDIPRLAPQVRRLMGEIDGQSAANRPKDDWLVNLDSGKKIPGSDSEVLSKADKAFQDFANSEAYSPASEFVTTLRKSGSSDEYILQELIDWGLSEDIAQRLLEFGF